LVSDRYARSEQPLAPKLWNWPYSPKCLEGVFSEVGIQDSA
jgi:hypothetical protein